MSKPKLVYVRWLDSSTPIVGWKFFVDIDPAETVPECETVGWLVSENAATFHIAGTICLAHDSAHQANCRIRIPKVAVLKMKRLKP